MKLRSDNAGINCTINTNTDKENNTVIETITTSTSTINTGNDETNVVIEENNTIG